MKDFARRLISRLPVVKDLSWRLKEHINRNRRRKMSPDEIFNYIFQANSWGRHSASVSGPGSDLRNTITLVTELPRLFSDLQIKSILDIPCGDFHWMQTVPLDSIRYVGGDIVENIIKGNAKYASDRVHFARMNLLEDNLPKVDLILCRDCLVHFSFELIFKAIQNISHTDAEYLLTTTFPKKKANRDIVTGDWRAINLECAPFNLPRPLRVVSEGFSERAEDSDKSLGLWRIEDLRRHLD